MQALLSQYCLGKSLQLQCHDYYMLLGPHQNHGPRAGEQREEVIWISQQSFSCGEDVEANSNFSFLPLYTRVFVQQL